MYDLHGQLFQDHLLLPFKAPSSAVYYNLVPQVVFLIYFAANMLTKRMLISLQCRTFSSLLEQSLALVQS